MLLCKILILDYIVLSDVEGANVWLKCLIKLEIEKLIIKAFCGGIWRREMKLAIHWKWKVVFSVRVVGGETKLLNWYERTELDSYVTVSNFWT